MRRSLLAPMLLLPTLVPGGWVATLALTQNGRPTLEIALRGVDPRDLLRGHYLIARLDLEDSGAAEAESTCVCLDPGSADPLRPRPRPLPSCAVEELARCPYPLRDSGRVFRLYLPEGKAPEIERLLRESPVQVTTRVRFHGDGSVDVGPPTLIDPAPSARDVPPLHKETP